MRTLDQVVLVTGAGRGIGRTAAEMLAKAGASVGVADIVPGLANEVAGLIQSSGGSALSLAGDLSTEGASVPRRRLSHRPLDGSIPSSITQCGSGMTPLKRSPQIRWNE